MKIAYLCDLDPLENWTYSGGNARIYKALQDQGVDLDILNASWYKAEIIRKLIHKMPDAFNLRARWRMHLFLSKIIAQGVRKELSKKNYDAIFCPYSFQSLANLDLPASLLQVFTADATPTTYKQSEISKNFGSYLSVSRHLDPLICRMEKRIFRAADLNLWPSEWQKKQADRLYDLTDTQSHVVPWGANIPDPENHSSLSPPPTNNSVKLLLVGRDWSAKGGPLVFETLEELRRRGVNAHLTVVGCTPPECQNCDAVTIFPSLDKSDPTEFAQLETLFRSAHFLFMPSFESYGFAFCEASAYGLPSLCLRIGGVPIQQNINGNALEPGANSNDFAAIIQNYIAAPDNYSNLRQSTRAYYKSTLNWEAWGARSTDLISEKLSLIRR